MCSFESSLLPAIARNSQFLAWCGSMSHWHLLLWKVGQKVLSAVTLVPPAPAPAFVLYMDAPKTACPCADYFWSSPRTILEIQAVLLALTHFCLFLLGYTLMDASDNTIMVSYINDVCGTCSSLPCCAVLCGRSCIFTGLTVGMTHSRQTQWISVLASAPSEYHPWVFCVQCCTIWIWIGLKIIVVIARLSSQVDISKDTISHWVCKVDFGIMLSIVLFAEILAAVYWLSHATSSSFYLHCLYNKSSGIHTWTTGGSTLLWFLLRLCDLAQPPPPTPLSVVFI